MLGELRPSLLTNAASPPHSRNEKKKKRQDEDVKTVAMMKVRIKWREEDKFPHDEESCMKDIKINYKYSYKNSLKCIE